MDARLSGCEPGQLLCPDFMDQLLFSPSVTSICLGFMRPVLSPPAGTRSLSRLALEQCDICAKVKGKWKLSRAVVVPLKEI